MDVGALTRFSGDLKTRETMEFYERASGAGFMLHTLDQAEFTKIFLTSR